MLGSVWRRPRLEKSGLLRLEKQKGAFFSEKMPILAEYAIDKTAAAP
jgi:hypothetical protein